MAVEKVVKETVVVEKEVAVEKVVKETVVVEKEVVITATPEPKPAVEKTLVIASSQEPDSLFPLIGNMAISGDVKSLMFRGIVEFDLTGPRCVLCEEFPTLQNGLWTIDEAAGTMELTYTLKKGIKWSDGTEITAGDVAFAFELMSDEQYEYGPSYIKPLAGIDVIDDYTFVAEYSELYPFADTQVFRMNLANEAFYRPLWEKYKNEGGDYWKRFTADEACAIKPIVNGPYMVEKWVAGSHITLVPNPNYNLTEAPKIQKINWRVIPDLNTLSVNVATRQVHLTDGWLSLEQARGLEEVSGVGLTFVPVIWLEHGTFQINEPPLDDLRVRQALLYGMDREALNEALFLGMQPPADSWLPPNHPAYNPDVKQYPYDPEQAGALLDEAGWKVGSDGIRVNDAGDTLTIIIVTIAGDRTREQVAGAIQSDWIELGIEVNIEPQTASLLFSESLPQNTLAPGSIAIWRWVIDYEASFVTAWKADDAPGANYDLLRTDSDWGKIERNVELIDEIMQTLDADKRFELLREQQAIWAENLPVMPVYWYTRVATVDERLQGFTPAASVPLGWNVETWDMVE